MPRPHRGIFSVFSDANRVDPHLGNKRNGQAGEFDQTRMAKFRPDGSGFEITSQGPCNIWGLVINGEGEVR